MAASAILLWRFLAAPRVEWRKLYATRVVIASARKVMPAKMPSVCGSCCSAGAMLAIRDSHQLGATTQTEEEKAEKKLERPVSFPFSYTRVL